MFPQLARRSCAASALVLWALATCGCSDAPTSLRLDVTLRAGGSAPSALEASIYGPSGALVLGRLLPAALPGTAIFTNLPAMTGSARVVVLGRGAAAPVGGWVITALKPGAQAQSSLELTTSFPDSDGDEVPDPIDVCPAAADRE